MPVPEKGKPKEKKSKGKPPPMISDIDPERSLCQFSVAFNIPLSRLPGVIENLRQYLP
jgi:hypothetical protein